MLYIILLLLSLLLIYLSSFPLPSVYSPPNLSSIHPIQSIRVGIWISLFMFHKNLTPHVLSEWMVEVCRFEVCWNRVWMFDVWCYYILYYILYLIIILLLYLKLLLYSLQIYLLFFLPSSSLLPFLFCSSFCSSPPDPFLISSHLSSVLFFLLPSFPFQSSNNLILSFKVYVSVVTYTYLYSYILIFLHIISSQYSFPIFSTLIQSIRVGIWISLFIYSSDHPSFLISSQSPPLLFSSSFKVYVSRVSYSYLYSLQMVSHPNQTI